MGEKEQGFLDRVQEILIVGTSLAVILILVVGILLNRRLNAPLQRLAAAVRAVAADDLEQQVETGGSIKVAQVGQAFNEMTAALLEAETLRQNMVADVAHELRNPLISIHVASCVQRLDKQRQGRKNMRPDPTNLLEMAGIETPLVGFYDVPDPKPFEPFCTPKRCIFSCYENWAEGESICIAEGNCSCRGGGYWIGGIVRESRFRHSKGNYRRNRYCYARALAF